MLLSGLALVIFCVIKYNLEVRPLYQFLQALLLERKNIILHVSRIEGKKSSIDANSRQIQQ